MLLFLAISPNMFAIESQQEFDSETLERAKLPPPRATRPQPCRPQHLYSQAVNQVFPCTTSQSGLVPRRRDEHLCKQQRHSHNGCVCICMCRFKSTNSNYILVIMFTALRVDKNNVFVFVSLKIYIRRAFYASGTTSSYIWNFRQNASGELSTVNTGKQTKQMDAALALESH